MALPLPVTHHPRIAVVDDSEAVRRSLLVLLGSRGYDVDAYPGGAELLSAVAAAEYDCFVIDLKLDRADGTQLLSALRKRGFTQPAVLISGWEVDSLERLAKQAGFAAHVRKPMMEISLADVLGRLLGKH
jgi:FixJ family two-component response regulator